MMNAKVSIGECPQRDAERFFHDLFVDYYPALVAFAGHYVGDGAVAEDLVQEVFVKLWETRERWEGVGDFSAYVYQMVRFKCFNYLRDERVRTEAMRGFTKEVRDAVGVEEADWYVEEEARRLLARAVESLPRACREVMELTLEGCRAREIAARLGIAEETVKKEKQVARRMLRERLGRLYLFLPAVVWL